jgi:bromodomain and WD repeat domain-containing protein 1/3
LSSTDDNPITPKKKKPPVEEIEDQSANDPNCTQESESSTNVHNVSIGEDSQGIETGGYCDFEDINVPHSSKIFSDIEVNASDFALKPNHNEDQQISMTYKSLPNPTLNHTKNKEVVRKRMTLVNGYDSDEYENEASLIDYENWLLESLPRYSPFIAQKGDRVLYLRDAHEIYLKNEIQDLKNSYRNFQCTESHINDTLKTDNYIIFAIVSDVKFFQINEIKFSVITLKSSSNETQFEFNVIYRPNRGICEFLVLEQFYKRSQEMNWQINSEFRSLWKKSWWIGVIENRSIFNRKYPQSLFKCFEVKWNTNETGRLSPWDLFVVDPNRLPKNKLNGILTTRKDLMESNYIPSDDEWPPIEGVDSQLWRCHECKRIYRGIKTVEKNITKSFISQFNNIKHKSVAYAVSLQLIKERLKNMYYRRIDSVKCDINYLKSNSKIYLKKSDYESAQNFIELILCIVNDPKCSESEDFLQYIDVYKHLFIETTGNLSHPSFDDHSYSSKAQKSVTKPLHSTPKPSFEAEKKKTTQKKVSLRSN